MDRDPQQEEAEGIDDDADYQRAIDSEQAAMGHIGLYAATDDEIKNAYRRMCMLFHPDKHHRPEDKLQEAAEKQFQMIQKAYDAILGGAISMTPMEWTASLLIGRLALVSELKRREEYERRRSALARNGVGAGTVVGTLRHVVSPTLWGELSTSVGQHSSTTFKVVNNFTSDVFASVNLHAKTMLSPPPITVSLGRKLSGHTTGYISYRTGEYTLSYWGADQDFRDRTSCGIGIIRRHESGQLSFDISAGEASSHISASYLRTVSKSLKARVSFTIGTAVGLQGSLAADKRVSKHDRIGIGIECGTLQGVAFRFKFIRLGQKFSVPVTLSPSLDLQLALWAAIIPLAAGFALDTWVFEPWRIKKHAEKLAEVRQQNADVLAERKRNSEDAVKLMREQVLRRVEIEEEKSGLVVVEAKYGKLPPSTVPRGAYIGRGLSLNTLRTMFGSDGDMQPPPYLDGHGEAFDNGANAADAGATASATVGDEAHEWVDVTVPVQNLVVNSQLHISGGHSKAHLVGFYDPCFGEAKRLRVIYKFRSNMHMVEVDDIAAVAAPLRAHMIGQLERA
ncbi:hypothetical protein HK101_009902 [Irineochytrium annulatum]|nr:hypothetical protein HK101_009902 [Irineochytrium annulatum]